jgi:hypothetical protein
MAASSDFLLAGRLAFGSRAKGLPGWWSRVNMAGCMAITAPRSLMRVGFLKILGFRFGGRQHDESPAQGVSFLASPGFLCCRVPVQEFRIFHCT